MSLRKKGTRVDPVAEGEEEGECPLVQAVILLSPPGSVSRPQLLVFLS